MKKIIMTILILCISISVYGASSRKTATNENVSTYGTGKDYVEGELTNWEQATDIDLVTATQSEVLEVFKEGVSGGLWDDTDTIDGATTNSSYFRIIRPASGEGHSGIPKDDGSVAGFRQIGAGTNILALSENYAQVQDLVFKFTISNGSTVAALSTGADVDEVWYVGCLLFDSINTGAGSLRGFSLYSEKIGGGGTYTVGAVNCLAHNITSTGGGTAYGFRFNTTGSKSVAYNCTATDCNNGFFNDDNSEAVYVRNCLADGSPGSDYATDGGSFTNSTCSSEDATSPTVALRSQSNTFVSSAGDDFHLASGDDAIDEGTDLSADGNYAFDDDIDFETRSGDWDIGFDEFFAATGATSAQVIMF